MGIRWVADCEIENLLPVVAFGTLRCQPHIKLT